MAVELLRTVSTLVLEPRGNLVPAMVKVSPEKNSLYTLYWFYLHNTVGFMVLDLNMAAIYYCTKMNNPPHTHWAYAQMRRFLCLC